MLCTDGDFNVGTTSTGELVRLAEQYAKNNVFLSVLGFGTGNLNDAMMEELSNKASGNYAFIDSDVEARRHLVDQVGATLVTIAKDVKIQIEFNPARVSAYRLIGYENRILAAQDFNDDKKDAGEIGAGHTVTALYEVVPAGADSNVTVPPVDPLRYRSTTESTDAAHSEELMTLKIRYKQPDADRSTLMRLQVSDAETEFSDASADFRFTAAVASFGMLLRNSQHSGSASWQGILELADELDVGADEYRAEFVEMVRRARGLSRG